jgi:hypothetical protein
LEVFVDLNKKYYPVASTFNIPAPANLMIAGNQEPGPFVPALDPSYVFRKEMLRDVLAWLADPGGEGLYLFGPTGCGKSSLICQIAARLNLPVARVNAHSRLELAELTGHFLLTGGSMHFAHGPLADALRDRHLFLLGELDLLDPATIAGLNTVLDGCALSIPETGEVIPPHPDFRFVATGNTSGLGDRTIQHWIDQGWLKARYEGKQRADETLCVTDEDFRFFWSRRPWEVPLYTLDYEGLEWFCSVMLDVSMNQVMGDLLARQDGREQKKLTQIKDIKNLKPYAFRWEPPIERIGSGVPHLRNKMVIRES